MAAEAINRAINGAGELFVSMQPVVFVALKDLKTPVNIVPEKHEYSKNTSNYFLNLLNNNKPLSKKIRAHYLYYYICW